MNGRYRVIPTSAGWRIYDFKLFDVVKQFGKWLLFNDRKQADREALRLTQEDRSIREEYARLSDAEKRAYDAQETMDRLQDLKRK